jgi:hypothetical protein
MKSRIVAVAAALALLSGNALAGGKELTPVHINTGQVPCDNGIRQIEWVNPHPYAVKIKSLSVWMGLIYSAKSDMGLWVENYKGVFARYANDRYDNPSDQNLNTWNYGEDWIAIPEGDTLTVNYQCYLIPGFTPSPTHVLVTFLYTN